MGRCVGKVKGIMIRSQRPPQQAEFWIARNDLARVQASRFYDKLDDGAVRGRV